MDEKIKLEERHSELVRIIESFEKLELSKEWATLKELVFDKEIISIERQLYLASLDTPLDTSILYTLQGRHIQAKRFEIYPYIETLKKELENINKKLK